VPNVPPTASTVGIELPILSMGSVGTLGHLTTGASLCCFTYHTCGVNMLNIGCPLGPYIPAAMTCLSAVQAPCPIQLHHMTPSAPQQAAQHSNNTSCNITPCTTPLTDVMPMLHECYTRLCIPSPSGLCKPITGHALCLEPDWQGAGTSLPHTLGMTWPIYRQCQISLSLHP